MNAFPDGEVTVRLLEKEPAFDYAADAAALYRDAGWIGEEDSVEFIPAVLKHSFCVVGAFYRGRMIGMMRALSDGVSDAYLLDMAVLTEFRGHGIAS